MWIIDGKNNLRQDKYDSARDEDQERCVRVRETPSAEYGQITWKMCLLAAAAGEREGGARGAVKIIDMILD